MAKQLTPAERYQFRLTGSSAKAIPAQRAAISRAGLTGATPATVLAARRAAFRDFRSKRPELAKLPAWVAAAQFVASGDDWLHVVDRPAGIPRDVAALASLAYSSVDWGRARKHSHGSGTAFPPRVREEDNGKTGWDRVVWRYADYLCIMSPDGQRVAIQTDATRPVEIHAVFRGQCLYRGQRVYLVLRDTPERTRMRPRDTARLLRLHGYDARVVRQTPEMIAAGSGDNIRTGETVVVIVPDGLGGWYHATTGQSAESVRAALAKRRVAAKAAELDAAIDSAADRIWVTLDDSTAAGNCLPGTREFLSTLRASIGAEGDIGAATARAVLSVRDDQFTRRACRVAALRYVR